jgi:anti-sigma-K factor RskA
MLIRKLAVVPALALTIAGVGCSWMQSRTTIPLSPGVDTPAAQGKVVVRETKNDNTAIDVEVDHLPRPAALDPQLDTFVVWAVPDGRRPVPLGQLRLDDDRSGSLKTQIPYRVADLLVTAESSPAPRAPSERVVLSGRIDMVRQSN